MKKIGKIILLHNKYPEYRVDFFNGLKVILKNNIDIWIYHEKVSKDRKVKSFKYLNWPINFSISVIWSLIFEKFDTLILSGSHSIELIFFLIIAKVRRKKIIFWTETWRWPRMNLKNLFFLNIIVFIASKSDRLIYPGKKVKELYSSLKIDKSKQFFAPNSSKNKDINFGSLKNRKSVGYYARIMPRKGLLSLIKSFKMVSKDFSLHIYGKVVDKNYYKKCLLKIKENENLFLYKKMSQEDFFEKFSIFVYPSTFKFGMAEPWGLALNEAVQANKIVISTMAVASGYDLIENGKNGFLIKDGSLTQISSAIKESTLLNAEVITETNRKKLNIYSYENMINGFLNAIKSL